jgi:hypothetical protein
MRLLLKLIFFLTLIFALCIGLIRTQSYDDSELRAFLTPPDGCPMPCFMGIRPGVTTREEVIAGLESHPWIGEITYPRTDTILWKWNDLVPDVLIADATAFVGSGFAGFIRLNENNTVAVLSIPTSIRFGEVWLIFGKPRLWDSRTIRIDGIDYARSQYCVGSPPFYWQTPILISIWDYSQFGGMGLGSGPSCLDE